MRTCSEYPFSCIWFLFFACIAGIAPTPLLASEPLRLGDQAEYFLQPGHLEVAEDSSHAWTVDQVSGPGWSGRFIPRSQLSSIRWNACYWVRFRVTNGVADDLHWLLESYDFTIDEITLYAPAGQGFRSVRAGDTYPFATKQIRHKNLVFSLPDVPPGRTQWFYLRIRSIKPFSLIFVLRSHPRFIGYALSEYYFLGIFYGILAAIALINLFFFTAVRDIAYLYYVFYVCSTGLFAASMDGTGFQYLWPDQPAINHHSIKFSILLMVISSVMYVRGFFRTWENAPRLDKFILLVLLLKIGLYLLNQWRPVILNKIVFDIFPVFVAYAVGILYLKRGFSLARYFVLAYSFLFLGYVVLTLRVLNLIPSTLLTFYAFNFSTVLEMIFLSVALAHRFKLVKKEKERAQEKIIEQLRENELLKDKMNRELEQKVQERTKELLLAYEEISRMNALLNIDNHCLEQTVKGLHQDRVNLKDVSYEDFLKTYPDEEACFRYLADLKWQHGYACRKCANTHHSKGKLDHSRRCTSCGYDESVTAYTLFYRLKFPIVKAFYIVFLTISRKNVSLEELSQVLDLRKMTCSAFKQKVLRAMEEKARTKNGRGKKEASDWSSYLLVTVEEQDTPAADSSAAAS
ncbi:MAG: hypothetical protein AVDCRST_MAG56-5278 [uncultured Cytophagales bacterium]|uniref:Uncharacterized protein n=1 Tax=uncultured Cytophagales bacterium TaxID=158755 RepID=A0A6J4K6U1_9SPHI|nr:MAG: hypothetical protein AVDCRST_MAG56-5278 [uncultured Cytophagales bacterium]